MAFSKITTRGMSGDTLEAGDIAANAIGASELADNAVDTAAIADLSVTNAKLPSNIISVKPHIQYGMLQPAVAGKDLSGTALGGSYTYGTAHTDGHSYYYTDIKGSKPIKDPRIGAHFGSQRHKFKTIQILEQETATQGENVYSIDGREWVKIYGGSPTFQNNANGNYLNCANVGSDKVIIEIVGYFSSVNLIAQGQAGGTRRFAPYIDGGSAGTNTTQPAVNSPLESRYVDSAMVQNITFNSALTTAGIHTLKLINDTNDIGIYGIELIAQDTTSTANRSKLQIPSQNVVSYGKKFTVSGTPHYDPFNGFTNGTTLHSANVDTATSLGLGTGTTWGAPWAISSSNHIRPFNGGRVVKWVDSSGTIKTSVTMMPRNAQNLDQDADNEITTASATNTHTINFSDDAVEHSLAEVAKTFHNRELGNGAANQGAGGTYADLSMLWATDDLAYVMDDGLTSLSVKDAVNTNTSGTKHSTACIIAATTSMHIYFTFIGTGIAWKNVIQSGSVSTYQIAQNLPYGTHVVKFNRSDYKVFVDGIHVQTVSSDDGDWAFHEFTIYQPKKPPVPEDACILADYMLMADYVQNTSATIGTISKGVRRIGGSRDHFYDCGGAIVAIGAGSFTYPWYWYGPGSHASNTMAVTLPYFGTSFTSFAEDQSQTHTFTLDGSAVTPTEADSDETRADLFYHAVSTLGQHTKVHTLPAGGYRFAGTDVASPTHTSHHYQTFETPLLHELVGGDRNMEQHNLIVTGDGKTWDEVTRDTSYIGNVCVSATTDTNESDASAIMVIDEWRGTDNTKNYYNKDFAVAYNRYICLVDGHYEIHVQTISQGAGVNGQHGGIKINGTLALVGHTGQSNLTSAPSDLNIHLKRGDYIQVTGKWYGGSSQVFDIFQIKRIN